MAEVPVVADLVLTNCYYVRKEHRRDSTGTD